MNINIQVPYTTKPSMTRRIGPAFNTNPDIKIIGSKKKEIYDLGPKLYGETTTSYELGLVRLASRYCKKKETDNIVELAYNFEEDIAIMHDGRLAAVCFCFPSGWFPCDKIGLTLSEIHAPVGDGEHLVKMSQKLASTMADPVLGGFERTVWTITNNSKLTNIPGSGPFTEPKSIDELYFRQEIQSTEPLGDCKTSLFFVKVNVIPLIEIWEQHGDKILDSINSMTEAVLKYKNLKVIKKLLNAI